jgi:hypothetical protein
VEYVAVQPKPLNHRETFDWTIEVKVKILCQTPVSPDLGTSVLDSKNFTIPDLSLVDPDVAADEARHFRPL